MLHAALAAITCPVLKLSGTATGSDAGQWYFRVSGDVNEYLAWLRRLAAREEKFRRQSGHLIRHRLG